MKVKILVIQQKMIGDVLVSSILCENLRLAYPNAQIDYLIYDSTKAVLDGMNCIDNLILFTKKERNNKLALLKFGLQLRKTKYDIIIDSYAKLESILLVILSGANTKISFTKTHSNLFYTHTVIRRNDYKSNLGLIIEQRLALLEPLKIDKKITNPVIYVNDEEVQFAKDVFLKHAIDTSKKTIMISIMGSDDLKTYPLQYMAHLIDSIIDTCDVNILFNYIPNQKKQALEVFSYCSTKTQKNIYIDIIGNSIREFIAIMNRCDCIVGNDGGAINMAKALNKPSFIVFSPWIDKKGWATFEDGQKNVSFHLKDFKPELFKGKTDKKVKKISKELYAHFKPELMAKQLINFLKINI
tara:strand:+ start:638 stop:1702 length:1065 start_codon:yes stop_codon:yes gene_type:complete